MLKKKHNKLIDPKKLVLLDRDGVINFDSDDYIKNPDEWEAIPGSLEAITSLNNAGIDVCLITNQSGIGRGLFNEATLTLIHNKLERKLKLLGGNITKIYYCPHLPKQNCQCRKPNTGMLDALEKDFDISVQGVPFIGDSEKDIELAYRKSCQPILVKTGKGNKLIKKGFKNSLLTEYTQIFNNLDSACKHLLSFNF
jgi:D-glycero-D-manno-heptose 1,7-bisphosphate phosphatase